LADNNHGGDSFVTQHDHNFIITISYEDLASWTIGGVLNRFWVKGLGKSGYYNTKKVLELTSQPDNSTSIVIGHVVNNVCISKEKRMPYFNNPR